MIHRWARAMLCVAAAWISAAGQARPIEQRCSVEDFSFHPARRGAQERAPALQIGPHSPDRIDWPGMASAAGSFQFVNVEPDDRAPSPDPFRLEDSPAAASPGRAVLEVSGPGMPAGQAVRENSLVLILMGGVICLVCLSRPKRRRRSSRPMIA